MLKLLYIFLKQTGLAPLTSKCRLIQFCPVCIHYSSFFWWCVYCHVKKWSALKVNLIEPNGTRRLFI